MLPIIIFLFCIPFRIKVLKAFESSLTIGIGLIGIFTIFNFFIETIGPVIQRLLSKTNLQYNVLDVGWPPFAAITWSSKLAPILLISILLINLILLLIKWTDTINIDIWNYWHFIFLSVLVYDSTNNFLISLLAGILSSIIVIKLADWSTNAVEKFSNLKGISITTLSSVVYYPIGVFGDYILNKIPGINKINAEPEYIKEKLGILGEPITIGFLMGSILSFISGYEVKEILEIAFKMAAVVYILPKMGEILSQGLMPVSDGIKEFLNVKFPNMSEKYVGLDMAVLMTQPSIIVTGLLLIPVAIIMALIIPGVNFIPIGDLPVIMGSVSMVVVASRGNIIRALIISMPIIAGKLLVASLMAQNYTELFQKVNFKIEGYSGIITSFLDGGNLFRFWFLRIFEGKPWALLIIPIIVVVLYYTKKQKK